MSPGRVRSGKDAQSHDTKSFRRASGTLLLGSAGGYGVIFALTPVVSRLVSPEEFGRFSALAALAAVFVGLSTMRLEVASLQERDDSRAQDILRLALCVAAAWSAAVLAACCIWVIVTKGDPLTLLAGPMAFVASVPLVASAWLVRHGAYKRVAHRKFAQGAGTGVIQVTVAAASPSAMALVTGYLVARVVWWTPLSWATRGWRRSTRMWTQVRSFAYPAGLSAFINSLAGQAPLLIVASTYGAAEVGLLAMAIRLLVAPLGVVAEAVAGATLGEVSKSLREHPERTRSIVTRGMRDLLLLALTPCLAAMLLGPLLIGPLLGSDWVSVGALVQALAIAALAQFVAAPFSQVLNLTQHVRWLLMWDLTRLVMFGAALLTPPLIGLDLIFAAWSYSLASALVYAILATLCVRAVSPVPPIPKKAEG